MLVADDEGEPVEDDERHEEARDGHAEKGDRRGDAVAEPVLVDRADDAEADADQRRQQVAGRGDGERAPEALGEKVGDRLVVDEGQAEIALQHHPLDPAEILLVERQIEAEPLADLVAQDERLLVAEAALAARQVGGVVGIVSGRRLDQHEGDDADHEEEAERRKPAPYQEPEHAARSPPWIRSGPGRAGENLRDPPLARSLGVSRPCSVHVRHLAGHQLGNLRLILRAIHMRSRSVLSSDH